MNELQDPARAVCGTLYEFSNAVHVRDMHANGGLRGNPHEIDQAWITFENSLRETTDIMRHPRPGEGLASIWLKAVCTRSVAARQAVVRYPNSWEELVTLDGDDLFWLVTTGLDVGYQLVKRKNPQDCDLALLMEPERSPIGRLRELAGEWSASRENAQDGLTVRNYMEHAGELVFQAIDAVEVKADWLAQESVHKQILKNVETPECFLRSQLREQSGEDLTALIDQLEPQKRSAPILAPSRSYSSPGNYARDAWLYENVQLHDYQTLSEMLEKQVNLKKWKRLSSRNGIKDAVKRYANHHGLPVRFFPDDRKLG